MTTSLLDIHDAPPADFAPGRMLNPVSVPWSHDINVSISKTTIGARAIETVHAEAQLNVRCQPSPVIRLSLESTSKNGDSARLEEIPFQLLVSQNGETTLSSEQESTPWHFLMRINPDSKQMSVSFTLDYSGLSVDKALNGVTFYESLASGGELRLQCRHPVTGAVLPIARGAIPEGSYPKPDSRFIELLKQLSFIESKTGEAFIIPEHNINFDEANTIAATARILETGQAQYTAKPWESVSSMHQARSALDAFSGGRPNSMAVPFEGQVVVIFGTHVMLGPVTFFCDRTYIAEDDLIDLRKQLESASADSQITIRFTPFEDCLVEARYLNWLPPDEAAAIRKLPIYQKREPVIDEDPWSLPPIDVASAVSLLTSWYDEDAEEQKEMWRLTKLALERDRFSDRKLFP